MASEEHVALFRQGAKIWNQWRQDNPDAEIYLRKAGLRCANLSKVDLNETKLIRAKLSDASH